MDVFGDRNVEHAVQGAVESGGKDLTVTGNRGKEKLSGKPSQPHDSLLACRGEQPEDSVHSETSTATEPLNIGQANVSRRTEDRNSSTSGLHRGRDSEWELLDSNLPITNTPCASRV